MIKWTLVAAATCATSTQLVKRCIEKQWQQDVQASRRGERRWIEPYFNLKGPDKTIVDAAVLAQLSSATVLGVQAISVVAPAALKRRMRPHRRFIFAVVIAIETMIFVGSTYQPDRADSQLFSF